MITGTSNNAHESADIAIKVENLRKVYKLYDSPQDRLKESLHPLRKKYHRDFYALDQVNLVIRRGDTVGIIGKNGSGKSTLLKVITGVLTPTAGAVTVNGKISALLELGAGFNPELTGLENVFFNGTLLGYSKEEMAEKVDDILAFADIGDFIFQPVKMYSSGMFVRLAFGLAIHVDPDILIVDEALAVGDIKFQRKCFNKIEQFRELRKTILFVSHGMETVHSLCSSAVLLNEGKVLMTGAPKKVTKVYQRMMLDDAFTSEVLARAIATDLCGSDSPAEDEKAIESSKHTSGLDEVVRTALAKLSAPESQAGLEIIDQAIFDEEENRTTVLESGCSYTFVVRLVVFSDIENLIVGYRIKNVKGMLLFGVNNRLQRIPIPRQTRGNIVEVSLKLDLHLAPGDYFLSLRSGTTENLMEELSDVIHFKVFGGSEIFPDSIVDLKPDMSVNIIENILTN